MPAVLCKNHGPFTWGKDAHDAVHNSVVLDEVAKMAARCERINPNVQPAPQVLQDKHYYRKHGANEYYGQNYFAFIIRQLTTPEPGSGVVFFNVKMVKLTS